MAEAIYIVVDPSNQLMQEFVEIEKEDSCSIKIGEWQDKGDGFMYLRMTPEDIIRA